MKNNTLFLWGLPSSGKTTLGKHLAKHYGYEFIDMDHLITLKEKRSIPEIFKSEGESYFRKVEQKVLHEIKDQENIIISTGGGAPCFFDNAEVMNEAGTSLFIDVSAEEIFRRLNYVKGKDSRPLLQEKSQDELLGELVNKRKERLQFYEKATHFIKGDQLTAQDLTTFLLYAE